MKKIYNFKKATLLFLLLLGSSLSVLAQGAIRYYWVGNGDKTSWNDLMNWSATSGGQGGVGVTDMPTPGNTVVFNQYSQLLSSRRVNISGTTTCDSLIVENCTSGTLPVLHVDGVLEIFGSLFLQSGVSFYSTKGSSSYLDGCILTFSSNRPYETIKTNGVALYAILDWSTLNQSERITFSGSATYKLEGDADFQDVRIKSGTLDFNGYNLSCNYFYVDGGTVIFPGSKINCRASWVNTSASPPITSLQTANSLIKIGLGSLTTQVGDIYHNVEVYWGNQNNSLSHTISNGTYNRITVLKGKTNFTGTVTTDTLIISAASAISLGSTTVIDYFEAKPAGCGGQVGLNTGTVTATGANIVIENAVIYNLRITGATANAEKSYDWGNNTGITFNPTTPPDAGRDLYWTGGSGYWGDPDHWLYNGSPANCIPTLADNVFFDATANSGGTAISSLNPVYLDMAAWCNNMTWNGVPGTPEFRLTGNNSSTNQFANYNPCTDNVVIGGSLYLQSTVLVSAIYYLETYTNSEFWFVSDRPNETINTNGGLTAANFVFQSASGTGGWKITNKIVLHNITSSSFSNGRESVADAGTNTGYYNIRSIYFNRGDLDMSGAKILARHFMGALNTSSLTGSILNYLPSRTLNIANAIIDLADSWQYLGGQQLTAIESDGSQILAGCDGIKGTIRVKRNDYYYNAEIRRREQGTIYNSEVGSGDIFFNKIVLSASSATINSTSTSYGLLQPDSLLFTGYGTYTIARSMKANKYIGTPLDCGGLTHITAASPVTITVGYDLPHDDRVKIRNTNFNNISVAPADTLYSVTNCNFTGTCNGWDNTNSPAQTFYWVGRAGDWSEKDNWSLTSGLSGGYKGDGTGCIPGINDNVIFDNGSFTAPNQRVTVSTMAYCDSMSWIGNTYIPQFYVNMALYIYGSLELQSGMVLNTDNTSTATLHFVTNKNVIETIKTNGATIRVYPIYFNAGNKQSGWKLLDNLAFNDQVYSGEICFLKGTLDLNENTFIRVNKFMGNDAATQINRKLIMTNVRLELYLNSSVTFAYLGEVSADGSTIILPKSNNTSTGSFECSPDAQFHNLEISGSNLSSIIIYRGNFNKITAKTGGIIFNQSASDKVVVDTLILANNIAHTYKFTSGSTLTVNEAFYGSGSACSHIFLQATGTLPAIFDIKKEAANYAGIDGSGVMDTLMINYAYIHGIKALTGPDNALLYKAWLCPDEIVSGLSYGLSAGNKNENWARMDPYAEGGSTPFEDYREVSCVFFPYELSSVNFAPTPTSRFKWFKCDYATLKAAFDGAPGSTSEAKFNNINLPVISTERNLLIYKGGRFTLLMDDGAGCVVYDDILIEMIICDECRMVEKCDGEWLTVGDLPYAPGAYTNLEIETAPGSGNYENLTLPLQVFEADNGRIIVFSDVEEGGSFAMAYLVVSPLPGPPEIDPNDLVFCAQATVGNLVARMSGSGIKIYKTPDGGDPMELSDMLEDGKTYYASQTVRNCEGTERLEITVHFITPCPVWEIWNWEDLSKVMEKQEDLAYPYRYFALMQDLGVPGQNNYGKGNNLAYSATSVQDAHKGDKRFGWYGYEGFIGGIGNIDTITPYAAGWTLLQVRDNAAKTAFDAASFIPYSNSGWNTAGWNTLGDATTPFAGIFFGQNFEVSGLWINRTGSDYQGLFGFVAGAAFSNLGVHLSEAGISVRHSAGILVGRVSYSSGATTDITNCYTTGAIKGNEYVGGFVGAVEGNVKITGCYTEGIVSGDSKVGGLAGQLGGIGTVGTVAELLKCYAACSVKGTGNEIGGFVGMTRLAEIKNCYASGKVKGNGIVGGFAGNTTLADISRCFASGDTVFGTTSVGGFIGEAQDGGTVSENFSLVSTVTGTGAKRVMGVKHTSVTLSNNMALSCMTVNGMVISGVVSANDNNGDNVSLANATQPTVGTYTGKNWDFTNIWTFDYEYDNLSKSWNVTNVTNLPILQVFNRWEFPKAVQPPMAECIKGGCYVELLSDNDEQTVCIYTPIEPIVYEVGNNIQGIGNPTGLPLGVSYTISGGFLTISGAPTQSGIFTFGLVPVGVCNALTITGEITVYPAPKAPKLKGRK